jgi:hypothetical protein
MARCILPILLLTAGCFWEEQQTTMVASNPFGYRPAMPLTRTSYAPASEELAALVDMVGHRVTKANPQLGLDPLFTTIGTPQLEIFHRGMLEILITEGLARQCATQGEGKLAAILCQELGKMVVEREALAGLQAGPPPPIDVRIGNDSAGALGAVDQVHQAEMGRYEVERRRKAAAMRQALDPQMLARIYLTKAGYPATDLDAAAPLLQSAADNNRFSKQMMTPPGAGPGR